MFNKLVIAAPRGTAKSTLAAEAFPLWCICYKVVEFILIISDTEDQAKMRLDTIKSELEGNERLRHLYGDLVGRENWGALEVETANGVKVIVKGTGQKIRGLKYRRRRPELVICDDILNEEMVESVEQRRKIKNWFYGTVLPGMDLDGMIVFIGTLLHEDDILHELLGAEDWVSMKRKIVEGGESLWPEAYSMERIEQIKRHYTSKGQLGLFYREYMNEIIASEEASFVRDQFGYIEEVELVKRVDQGESLTCFLTVDLAYQATSSHDFTAFAVVYMDENQVLYVKDIVRGKFGLTGAIDKLFLLVEEYAPKRIGIQHIDWTRSLKVPVEAEMRRRNVSFVVTPLKTYSKSLANMQSKQARIERLAPRYANHQVFHITQNHLPSPGISRLEEELLAFPKSKFDDCSDALSMVLDLAFPPQKRSQRSYPAFLDDTPMDYISDVSGY